MLFSDITITNGYLHGQACLSRCSLPTRQSKLALFLTLHTLWPSRDHPFCTLPSVASFLPSRRPAQSGRSRALFPGRYLHRCSSSVIIQCPTGCPGLQIRWSSLFYFFPFCTDLSPFRLLGPKKNCRCLFGGRKSGKGVALACSCNRFPLHRLAQGLAGSGYLPPFTTVLPARPWPPRPHVPFSDPRSPCFLGSMKGTDSPIDKFPLLLL
ncbi:hypothetical protein VTK73DRAFT_9837 [Phialemonium thermophilum]|uniref:Uncharacterized protein n=1 Tax=Phialemonium thermophilum TaxID=223376 RepID=A0ABR3W025_9PEZI